MLWSSSAASEALSPNGLVALCRVAWRLCELATAWVLVTWVLVTGTVHANPSAPLDGGATTASASGNLLTAFGVEVVSITIHEATETIVYPVEDVALTLDIAEESAAAKDFGTADTFYDAYIATPAGTLDPATGLWLTIDAFQTTSGVFGAQAGHTIDAVSLDLVNGDKLWAREVTTFELGALDPANATQDRIDKVASLAEALGEPDGEVTHVGSGRSSLTLGFFTGDFNEDGAADFRDLQLLGDQFGLLETDSDFDERFNLELTPTLVTQNATALSLEVIDEHDLALFDRIRGFNTGRPRATILSVSTTRGFAPLEVAFTGEGFDPEGNLASLEWDFDFEDDSAVDATGSSPGAYTYETPGRYTARLTVFDSEGKSGQAAVEIEVLASASQFTDLEIEPDETVVTKDSATHFDEIPHLNHLAAAILGGDPRILSTSATRTTYERQADEDFDFFDDYAVVVFDSDETIQEFRTQMLADIGAENFVGVVRFRGGFYVLSKYTIGDEVFLHFQQDTAGGFYETPVGSFEAPPLGDSHTFFSMSFPGDDLPMLIREAMPPVNSFEAVPNLRILDEFEDPERVQIFLDDCPDTEDSYDFGEDDEPVEDLEHLETVVECTPSLIFELTAAAGDGGGARLDKKIGKAGKKGLKKGEKLGKKVLKLATGIVDGLRGVKDAIKKLLINSSSRDYNLFNKWQGVKNQLDGRIDDFRQLRDLFSGAGRDLSGKPLALLEDLRELSEGAAGGGAGGSQDGLRVAASGFVEMWVANGFKDEILELARLVWGPAFDAAGQIDVGNYLDEFIANRSFTIRVSAGRSSCSPRIFVKYGTFKALDLKLSGFKDYLKGLPGGKNRGLEGTMRALVKKIDDAFCTILEETNVKGELEVKYTKSTKTFSVTAVVESDVVVTTISLIGSLSHNRVSFNVTTTFPGIDELKRIELNFAVNLSGLNDGAKRKEFLHNPLTLELTLEGQFRGTPFVIKAKPNVSGAIAANLVIGVRGGAGCEVTGKFNAAVTFSLSLPLNTPDDLAANFADCGNANTSLCDLADALADALRGSSVTEEAFSPGAGANPALALASFADLTPLIQDVLSQLALSLGQTAERVSLGVSISFAAGGGIGCDVPVGEGTASILGKASFGMSMPVPLFIDLMQLYSAENPLLSTEYLEQSLSTQNCVADADGFLPPSFDTFLSMGGSLGGVVDAARAGVAGATARLENFAKNASFAAALGVRLTPEVDFGLASARATAGIDAKLSTNGQAMLSLLGKADPIPGIPAVVTLTMPLSVSAGISTSKVQTGAFFVGVCGGVSLSLLEAVLEVDLAEEELGPDRVVEMSPDLEDHGGDPDGFPAPPASKPLRVPLGSTVHFAARTFAPPGATPILADELCWRFSDPDGPADPDCDCVPGAAVESRTYNEIGPHSITVRSTSGGFVADDAFLVEVYAGTLAPPDVVLSGPTAYAGTLTVDPELFAVGGNAIAPEVTLRKTPADGTLAIVGVVLNVTASELQFTADIADDDTNVGDWDVEVVQGTLRLVLPAALSVSRPVFVDSPWPTLGRNPQRTSQSGTLLDSTPLPGPTSLASTSLPKIGVNGIGPPVLGVVGGASRIYIGGESGNLRAVDPAAGQVLWSFDGGAGGTRPVTTAPVVATDGTVYYYNGNGVFFAVRDVAAGGGAFQAQELWKWDALSDAESLSSPAMDSDGKLYFGNENGELFGFESTGGAPFLEWCFAVDCPSGHVSSPVISADGAIYFVYTQVVVDPKLGERGQNTLIAVENGAEKWRQDVGGSIRSDVALRTSVMIAPDGTIYVTAGCQLWAATDNTSSAALRLVWSDCPASAPESYIVPDGALEAFEENNLIYLGVRHVGFAEGPTFFSLEDDGSACADGDAFCRNRERYSQFVPVSGISLDSDGNVYVAGQALDFVVLGDARAYDRGGNALWDHSQSGVGFVQAPVIDRNRRAYVAASERNTAPDASDVHILILEDN